MNLVSRLLPLNHVLLGLEVSSKKRLFEQIGLLFENSRQIPRSRVFDSWDALASLDLPVTVVASRDEADPEHPYATGERYAATIPGAQLVSEDPGKSPLAWQGGQLSRVIAETASR